MISGFRTNIIIRVILLSATIILFWRLIDLRAYIWTPAGLGALIIFQIFRLVYYLEKTHRMLAAFFNSMRSGDYSQSFNDKRGTAFKEVAHEMETINNEMKELKEKNQEQYLYLKRIFEHVSVGLIAVEDNGKIDFINRAALNYLGIREISGIKQLYSGYPVFKRIMENKHKQESPISINPRTSLSVNSELLKFKSRNIRIISFKNIKKELDETEFISWEKIIQVMAHEIMNSITPISTLSKTISLILEDTGTDTDDLQEIGEASAIIEKRCAGLMAFVRHYKDLISIPRVEISGVIVNKLYDSVYSLLKPEIEKRKIRITKKIEQPPIIVNADVKLLEQILINLFNNAFDALDGVENPEVEFAAYHDLSGNTVIKISDNGRGITPEQMDKVFIPFYTTKQNGSGIGLSLAREIMRHHRGFINITSEKNITAVMLTFTE